MENGDEFSPPDLPSLPAIHPESASILPVLDNLSRRGREERGGKWRRLFHRERDFVARDRKTYYDYKVESVVTNRDVHLSPAG